MRRLARYITARLPKPSPQSNAPLFKAQVPRLPSLMRHLEISTSALPSMITSISASGTFRAYMHARSYHSHPVRPKMTTFHRRPATIDLCAKMRNPTVIFASLTHNSRFSDTFMILQLPLLSLSRQSVQLHHHLKIRCLNCAPSFCCPDAFIAGTVRYR